MFLLNLPSVEHFCSTPISATFLNFPSMINVSKILCFGYSTARLGDCLKYFRWLIDYVVSTHYD